MQATRRRMVMVLCGVIAALLLLELGLRIGGWALGARDAARDPFTAGSRAGSSERRILCLGPCYTVGVGAAPENTYPRYLERSLRQRHPRVSWAVINRGIRNKNLSFFTAHLERLIEAYRPAVIILNINDRIDPGDKTIFLSCPQCFSWPDRIKFGLESFLYNFRVYRMARAFFSKSRHPSLRTGERLRYLRADESDSQNAVEIRELEARAKDDPGDASVYAGLARAYFYQGLFEASAENSKKALALSPGNGWFYLDLFWDYVFLHDYEKAEEARKKAFEVSPQIAGSLRAEIKRLLDSPDARSAVPDMFFLSDRYALLGNYAEALRRCREALEYNPSYVEYYDKMAFYEAVLHQDRDDRAALRFFVEQDKPWGFMERAKSRFSRADGYAVFERWVRYNLGKARAAAAREGIQIVVENIGSCARQQAVINRVCADLRIPLCDLYTAFRSAERKDVLFDPLLSSRLSAEGNRFMAEQIYESLRKNGMLDESAR